MFVSAIAATAAIVALPKHKTTEDRVADWLVDSDACWGVEQWAVNQEPPLAARAASRTWLDCIVSRDGQQPEKQRSPARAGLLPRWS
jgi:hypothetical protein